MFVGKLRIKRNKILQKRKRNRTKRKSYHTEWNILFITWYILYNTKKNIYHFIIYLFSSHIALLHLYNHFQFFFSFSSRRKWCLFHLCKISKDIFLIQTTNRRAYTKTMDSKQRSTLCPFNNFWKASFASFWSGVCHIWLIFFKQLPQYSYILILTFPHIMPQF